jgi:4-amino-4-deoxy-L-arabinose transferase-like glycosyltransferase
MWLTDGFDPTGPQVPIYGVDGRFPLHLPVMSYLGYLFAQVTHEERVSTRLASLILYQIAAVCLYVIVNRLSGSNWGVVSVAIFELTPFGIIWSTSTVPDVASTTLLLGAVASLLSHWPGPTRWAIALIFFSVALAIKPVGIVLYTPLVLFIITFEKERQFKNLDSTSGPSILREFSSSLVFVFLSFIPLGIWSAHSWSIRKVNQGGLHTNPAEDITYFFGSLLRSDAGTIGKTLFHETQYTVGSALIMAFLGIWAVLGSRNNRRSMALLGCFAIPVCIPPLLMTQYASFHAYFALNAQPAVIVLATLGLQQLTIRFSQLKLKWSHFFTTTALLSSVIAAAWISFLVIEKLQVAGYSNVVGGVIGGAVATIAFVFAITILFIGHKRESGRRMSALVVTTMCALTSGLGLIVYHIAWDSTLDAPLYTKEIQAIQDSTDQNDFIVMFGCNNNAIVFFESETRGLQTSLAAKPSNRLRSSLSAASFAFNCERSVIPLHIQSLLRTYGFKSDSKDSRKWRKQNE